MSEIPEGSGSSAPPTRGGDYSPDRGRMQLLWLAMGLIGILTLALVLLVAYGLEVTDADYTEPLLLIGLLAFVTCTVAYFADKEREHRAENRRLIEKLQKTAGALDKRVARLNKLSETSVRLAGALDLDRISELVVGALVDQVQADAASFVLMDTARGEYVHRRSAGALAEGDERETPLDMAAKAARGGPSIGELQQAPPVSEQLVVWDSIRASISAPMNVSEVVNGALAAIREESFDTEDLNLLTTLANMSSKAVESAELHQQLRQSYYRTLHVLARSLAARDLYSAAHGEAVTCLAEKIGGELRLSEDNIEALKSYGPLHDLGKIGISDVLLGKQGPLTEEEFELVRQHPLIGESIIRPLDPGDEALSMIRSHHERWDGKGYPDGLHGDETPQLARVVAVADVYHAIVSHRPYRGGASPIRAVQEIKSMSSTQFDPTVVKALVNLWHAGALTDLRISGTEAGQASDILEVPVAVAAPVPRSAG